MVEWYRRFGDIPGVHYESNPKVVRRKLRGHDATPELQVFEFEGERRESLSWPTREGSSSASPVHSRAFGVDLQESPTRELLQHLYEGLELPGEPADYHFLIQGCLDLLWKRRREEPEVLEQIETLCLLDIHLIEARPQAVSHEQDDKTSFFQIKAFSVLIDLYEREGLLKDALEIAETATRFDQGAKDRERILNRLAALEEESIE